MPTMSFEEISTNEVMARLGVKQRSTISLWVRNGRLTPSRRLGDGPKAQYLFWRADIEVLAAELAAVLRDQLATLERTAS